MPFLAPNERKLPAPANLDVVSCREWIVKEVFRDSRLLPESEFICRTTLVKGAPTTFDM
jgi:hypothetical protein